MAGLNVDGPNVVFPNQLPTRLIKAHFSLDGGVDNESWGNTFGNSFFVGGCDLVIKSVDADGPYFVYFAVGGTLFYYDSQSVGEGHGLDFSWRGFHEIRYEESLTMTVDSNGFTGDAYFMAWGYYMAQPQVLT